MLQRLTFVGMALVAIPIAGFCQPDTLWTQPLRDRQNNRVDFGDITRVIRTFDGNLAYAGYGTNERGDGRWDSDFKVAISDTFARQIWYRLFHANIDGQDGGDRLYAICQLPDSGFTLAGSRLGIVALRIDKFGNLVWMRYFLERDGFNSPGPGEMNIILANDGNFVFVSYRSLYKITSEDGGLIWRRNFEGRLTRAHLTSDGGFFLAGFTTDRSNVYAARTDSDGELIWQQIYLDDNQTAEQSWTSIPSSAGGWILAGSSRFGGGGIDYYPFLMHIGEDRELLWYRLYDDMRANGVRQLLETPDGGYAIIGYSGSAQFWRTDYFGERVWRTFYRPIGAIGNAVLPMEDGGYLLGIFHFREGIPFGLIRTAPDPYKPPYELDALTDALEFGEVPLDTVTSLECRLYNYGRRYVVLDSASFAVGDDGRIGIRLYAHDLDFPVRINPTDTLAFRLFFRPSDERDYADTLTFFYADSSLSITMSGRGVPLAVPDDGGIGIPPYAMHLSAFPNPFNTTLQLHYTLPRPGHWALRLYDLRGAEVMLLKEGFLPFGPHQLHFNAGALPSGQYMLALNGASGIRTRRVVLVK
ncbi:MAG: T9SS type A sorting domain-containing protein [Calditrichaeota bacterium]|nr:T9SS type A sorting domain-containing protein [Calditrichota bacterium]